MYWFLQEGEGVIGSFDTGSLSSACAQESDLELVKQNAFKKLIEIGILNYRYSYSVGGENVDIRNDARSVG